MPITDQDRQAFQDVIKMPGFFTMGPGVQRNALRSVGVFAKADDGVLDQVLSRVKGAMPADFQGSPLGFTQPPPRLGMTPQPVGRTEGIREEAVKSILGTSPGQNPEYTYEAKNGDVTMVPRKQPGTGNKWTDFEQGFSQGMTQVGVDLTSPANIAMMAGSFMKFPKMAAKFPRMFKAVQGAVKTGFGIQMFEGILDEIPEAKKAFDRGDYQSAGAAVSKALVDIGFLGGLTKEPIEKGAAKVRQKVGALRNPPAAAPTPTTAAPVPPIEQVVKPTAPPPKPAPRQPGLFEPPEPATAPPTAAPPTPSAPVQAQGALTSKAKELFGESLGQEYADAVKAGDAEAVKQFEAALAPEQLKELEPLKPKAESKPAAAPTPPTPSSKPPEPSTKPDVATPAPPTSEPRRGVWTPAEPVPGLGEVVPMNPKDIVADPKRFQFKREAVGKSGTTDKLEDVQKFDPRKAGVIAVWKDPADGKVYVSNGHHRLELAKRADAGKINVQFLEAADAKEAMVQGAVINLAEGQGTATDAAKLFRDAKLTPEDLKREGLSVKGKLVTQGLALAKLDPSIFQTVVDGTITPEQGTLIGEKMPDSPVQQKKVVEYLARKQQGGETVKPGKLSEFIDFVRGSETKTDTVEDLFGEQQIETSLADEKATISDYIRDALGKEKRLFGTVGKSGVSETLKRGGNVISESENQKISEGAAQALAVYDKLKLSAGPVSDILNDAARELAEGGKSGEVKTRAYERVRNAVAQLLGGKPAGEGSAGGGAGGAAKPPQDGGKGATEGDRGGAARELPLTEPPPTFGKPAPSKLSGTGGVAGTERSPVSELKPPTDRPEPTRLRKPKQPPAPPAGPGGTKSSAALTETGRVKLGADVKSLGEVLGSSLYSGKEAHIVTKELMQNAFDAIRGVKGGQVEVTVDPATKTITIADNGKGMTAKELATVFTDLGSSGKRESADASGGFGLAKAAPLMMSEQIEVQSTADVGGKRILSIMRATPDQLLGEGVQIEQHESTKNTPTGTKIISKLPANSQGWWEADRFVRDFQKSVKMPGKLVARDRYGSMSTGSDRGKLKSIGTLTTDGAEVELFASSETKKGMMNAMGGVPVEINNNGIYQFDSNIYLGGAAQMKEMPAVISANVRSTVKEGDPRYPFTANRERLRGDVEPKIQEWVKKNIVDPALRRANDFISEKYNSLPTMASPNYDVAVFDSGARMTPAEFKKVSTDPDMVNLGEEMAIMVDKSLTKLIGSKALPENLKGLGSGIERAGFVFSEQLHGVHITNKATGKATVFVNPFSYPEAATPTEAASMLWHTVKHELLHDKIEGHNQSFTTGEVKVAQALGDLELEALLRLRSAYADPGSADYSKFRKGIDRSLQVYRESRGRAERERDPFGGQESRAGDSGSRSVAGQAPTVSGSRAGAVRPGESGAGRTQPPPVSRTMTAPPPGR